MSRIRSIAYHFPEASLTNAQLAELFPEWSADKIVLKTGIETRYIVAKEETALDLGVRAAEKIFKSDPALRDIVDGLVFCTESPDYTIPPNACLAQSELGLSDQVIAFDYSLGCSGYVYGLSIAHGLIASGQASTILLITAETYSKLLDEDDRGVRTLFGDGATATIVEKSLHNEIGKFAFYTNGEQAHNLIVPHSGAATEKLKKQEKPLIAGHKAHDKLYMNGPAIFQFTLDIVPNLIQRCMDTEELSYDDIDHVVMHQANKFMLDNLRIKCKIPNEKFVIDVKDGGNTVSNTIPIALARALDSGTIKQGDKVLLAGFGVGLSAAAVVVQI